MNNILKSVLLPGLLVLFPACGTNQVETAKAAHLSQAGRPSSTALFSSDSIRQNGIAEEHFRDNFVFDQFKDIDWSNLSTYGEIEHNVGLAATVAIKPIPEASLIGLTPANYFEVAIKGDGNCWLRASMISFFHIVFSDPKLVDLLIQQIHVVAQKYEDVPGFSGRFYPQPFAQLIKTLSGLSPQERLAQFNKSMVDKFLLYSLRAVLHAERFTHYEKAGDFDHIFERLKKFLTAGEWGSASDRTVIWAQFLPRQALLSLNDSCKEIIFLDKEHRSIDQWFIPNVTKYLVDGVEREIDPFTLKNTFGIEILSDFAQSPFLEVIPLFINGNHYNLAVKKSIIGKFGY